MTGKAEDLIKWLFNQDKEKLFDVQEHKEKRSLNANGLLWACLGEIAKALRTDKWSVYLQMLQRYGQFTYICVKPRVVEMVKKQWRECEEIGHVNINGQDSVQLLCYFGSSQYSSSDFSVLLDGVISEMKEMGLETPAQRDLDRVIERMKREESNGKDKSDNQET